MGKTVVAKNPSRWRSALSVGIPFVAGLPFQVVSRQTWIVSLVFVGVAFLLALVHCLSNKPKDKQMEWRGLWTGPEGFLLKGAIGFCLSSCLAAIPSVVKKEFMESRSEKENRILYEQYFSDIDNIILAEEYLSEKGIAPEPAAFADLKFPPRLLKAALGYCEYKKGNYREAREAFGTDMSHNPISAYYLGLMTWLGLGDIPNREEGLGLIRRAAKGQVHEAQLFLFYQAIKDNDYEAAEFYSDAIFRNGEATSRICSRELQTVTNIPVHPYLMGRFEVLEIMSDYYLRVGKCEKAIECADSFCSLFENNHSVDVVRTTLVLNYLEVSGNAHQIKREIHRGARRGNSYCLFKAAQQILYDKEGNLRNEKDIPDRDLKKAENYLKKAVVGGDHLALAKLTAMYYERGDSLAALEADHMYSLAEMVYDVTRK